MGALQYLWRYRWLYVLALPAVAAVIVFNYLPIYGISLAFRDFNASLGPFRSPWSKPLFYNFWFLQDSEFWYVLRNTVRISVVKFVFSWPAPIVLALLLNEVRRSRLQARGADDQLPPPLHLLGDPGRHHLPRPGFRGRQPDQPGPRPVRPGPGCADGRSVLLSAAGGDHGDLQGGGLGHDHLPGRHEHHQSRALRAGRDRRRRRRMRQAWNITLPGILPIIAILLVLQIPAILQAGLDQIWNLSNPATRPGRLYHRYLRDPHRPHGRGSTRSPPRSA